eukprot:CAMPEP_0194186680 /NCGR_PEP_ID=MMETSP0154-20130528/47914_1 /TAXON_ID=1049557 /ORGANISM="Thalassiothrix antarctica, Strain L6-D1" /LENGTH=630 /DNA_ID=CAMNT_0038905899 /DNA_START=115 /DNA_END=2007 /DNA_ORIENTATION=+
MNVLFAILSLLSVGVTSQISNETVCQSILDSNPGASTCVEAAGSGGAAFFGKALTNDYGIEVDSFKGIRFADFPERFDPSEVVAVKDGDRVNAMEFGAACQQLPNSDFDTNVLMDEDCLYLNIWKPSSVKEGVKGDLLPVMVFIHGGAFTTGAGSAPPYDGANLAGNENVVVVTINYRLGVFGFMPKDNKQTGNMNGILDQIQALHWVQNNIEIFGGNLKLVTIFGESAGAISVMLLSVIPRANGLFQRAITESGSDNRPFILKGVEDVLNAIECSEPPCTISDMKDMGTEELMNATAAFEFSPTEYPDPAVLPTSASILYSEGAINPKEMIMGANTFDDYIMGGPDISFYIDMAERGITDRPFFDYFNITTPEETQAAIDAYSWDKFNGSSVAAMGQMIGDLFFNCPSRDIAVSAATSGFDGKIFVYHFGQLSKCDPAYRNGLMNVANITYTNFTGHAGELLFVFGHVCEEDSNSSLDGNKKLSSEIMSRWANFARSGNPNLSNEEEAVEWLPVSVSDTSGMAAADPQYMYFTGEGGVMVESDTEKMEQCAAIWLLNPMFNHANKNITIIPSDKNDTIISSDKNDTDMKGDANNGNKTIITSGVATSFAGASTAQLLAALAIALVVTVS